MNVVRGVVDSMTVSKELRVVAEALMLADEREEFRHTLDKIDKSYEKRELALRALGADKEPYFRSVVEAIRLSSELRLVAEKTYELQRAALALWVLQFSDLDAKT